MSTGRPTLGDLVLKTGMEYQTILDILIRSEEGTHGCLKAILEVEEHTSAAQVSKLFGQAVEVTLRDGTRLFTGECTGAVLTGRGGYQCVCLTAATRSVRMDRKKQKKTFQDPGKTLASVCAEIGETYGAFITTGQDIPIRQVLCQQDETDWEFLLRIAAGSGNVVYTDLLAEGIRIFVGEKGFRRYGEEILGEESSMTRNLAEMASIEANLGEAAEGYMVLFSILNDAPFFTLNGTDMT